jgi:hypothetical protein
MKRWLADGWLKAMALLLAVFVWALFHWGRPPVPAEPGETETAGAR